MSQSTGTAPGRQSSTTPALAYTNPQPRLPGSEASPPTQPETFIRRARRVQTGSCTLKIWYLALCTFGRAWVRDTDRVTIGSSARRSPANWNAGSTPSGTGWRICGRLG